MPTSDGSTSSQANTILITHLSTGVHPLDAWVRRLLRDELPDSWAKAIADQPRHALSSFAQRPHLSSELTFVFPVIEVVLLKAKQKSLN